MVESPVLREVEFHTTLWQSPPTSISSSDCGLQSAFAPDSRSTPSDTGFETDSIVSSLGSHDIFPSPVVLVTSPSPFCSDLASEESIARDVERSAAASQRRKRTVWASVSFILFICATVLPYSLTGGYGGARAAAIGVVWPVLLAIAGLGIYFYCDYSTQTSYFKLKWSLFISWFFIAAALVLTYWLTGESFEDEVPWFVFWLCALVAWFILFSPRAQKWYEIRQVERDLEVAAASSISESSPFTPLEIEPEPLSVPDVTVFSTSTSEEIDHVLSREGVRHGALQPFTPVLHPSLMQHKPGATPGPPSVVLGAAALLPPTPLSISPISLRDEAQSPVVSAVSIRTKGLAYQSVLFQSPQSSSDSGSSPNPIFLLRSPSPHDVSLEHPQPMRNVPIAVGLPPLPAPCPPDIPSTDAELHEPTPV